MHEESRVTPEPSKAVAPPPHSSGMHTPHRGRLDAIPGGIWGGLAMLAFLGLRLGILLSAPDRLGHLGEGELGHANLALDLQAHLAGVENILRPLWAYQVVPFHGGTWISSLLFVPFSVVFGLSWLSLKGLALAFASTTLVLWMWSLQRLAGRGAAAMFGWLMALAPPVLVRMQLTLWGTHAEVSALQALGMAVLVAGLVRHSGLHDSGLHDSGLHDSGLHTHPREDREEGRSSAQGGVSASFGWYLVLGAVAGLAVAFNYSALVSSGLLLVAGMLTWRSDRRTFHAAKDRPDTASHSGGRLPSAGGVGGLLVGGFVGLLPLLYLILGGRGSLKVYEQGLSSAGTPGLLDGALRRLPDLPRLLLELPPLSPQLPPGPSGVLTPLGVFLHLLLFGAAAGVLWRGWQGWRHPTPEASGPARVCGVLGLYPFVFALTFVLVHLPFSSSSANVFGFCPRYAATLYPFLYASLAVGTVLLLQAVGAGRWPGVVRVGLGLSLSLFLLPSLADDLRMLEPSTPHLGLTYDPLPLTRADLWAVDRTSIRGIELFMQLDQSRRVPKQVARGFRALLSEPWSSEYWQFLEAPPDGPPPDQVEARRQQLLSEAPPEDAAASGYALGLLWASQVALGQVEPPADVVRVLKEPRP